MLNPILVKGAKFIGAQIAGDLIVLGLGITAGVTIGIAQRGINSLKENPPKFPEVKLPELKIPGVRNPFHKAEATA